MILVFRSFVIAIAALILRLRFRLPASNSKPSTLFGLVMLAAIGEISRVKNSPG